MMTDCPKFAVSGWATRRAATSDGPPGGYGTTILISLLGKDCASAWSKVAKLTAATTARKTRCATMSPLAIRPFGGDFCAISNESLKEPMAAAISFLPLSTPTAIFHLLGFSRDNFAFEHARRWLIAVASDWETPSPDQI